MTKTGSSNIFYFSIYLIGAYNLWNDIKKYKKEQTAKLKLKLQKQKIPVKYF